LVRGPEFTGKAADMLAVYQSGSSCLLVLDPIYSQLGVKRSRYFKFWDLTNFGQIIDTGSAQTSFPQGVRQNIHQ